MISVTINNIYPCYIDVFGQWILGSIIFEKKSKGFVCIVYFHVSFCIFICTYYWYYENLLANSWTNHIFRDSVCWCSTGVAESIQVLWVLNSEQCRGNDSKWCCRSVLFKMYTRLLETQQKNTICGLVSFWQFIFNQKCYTLPTAHSDLKTHSILHANILFLDETLARNIY